MAKIIYSNSFLQFLGNSNCKVAQVLYSLHCKNESYYRNYNSLILTDSEVNYLTFRNDGTISYLPAGKECIKNENGEWKRDNRQHGKPAKIIRKLFCDRAKKWFKDSDFECFTNQYKANFKCDGYTFELLSHSKIPDVYCIDRASGDGSLNNSCMNNDREYLSIYAGCKKLQILTLNNKEGLLCGRALVWTIDDTITLMDRIYVVEDYQYDMFLSYCEDKEWYRKKDYKSYSDKTNFVTPTGETVYKEFTINTPTGFDYYPYIDTFCYGSDGSLNNFGDGCYSYSNTDGTRDGDEEQDDDHDGESYDDFTDEWIDDYEAVYINAGERRFRDRTCHRNNAIEVDGDWYYEDDCNIVNVDGEYYRKDSDDICCIDGDYHLVSDCVYSDYHNEYILESDSIEVDGEYFHEDDEDELIVKVDGDWFKVESDDIVKVAGDWYKKDSDDIVEIEDGIFLLKSEIEDDDIVAV